MTFKPYDWIRTARDQNEVSQQEFYKHCKIILQPTDTTEKWWDMEKPAGSATTRGTSSIMLQKWRTSLAHLRDDMAEAARLRGLELGEMNASLASWEEVFDTIVDPKKPHIVNSDFVIT